MTSFTIETYLQVLNGEISRFPTGFWTANDRYIKAAQITRYMIEFILKWDKEQVSKSLNKYTFRNHKLLGMLAIFFNNSPYYALDNAYPDEYLPWELSRAPLNTWDKKTASEALKWAIEVKEKLSRNDICKLYDYSFIMKHKLKAAYILFDSEFDYINSAYPGRFLPWDFKQCPQSFWDNENNKVKAIKWLVEEKLQLNPSKNLKLQPMDFIDNDLGGLLVKFNNSWRDAILFAYPSLSS